MNLLSWYQRIHRLQDRNLATGNRATLRDPLSLRNHGTKMTALNAIPLPSPCLWPPVSRRVLMIRIWQHVKGYQAPLYWPAWAVLSCTQACRLSSHGRLSRQRSSLGGSYEMVGLVYTQPTNRWHIQGTARGPLPRTSSQEIATLGLPPLKEFLL